MNNDKRSKDINFDVEIGLKDNGKWSKDKFAQIKKFSKSVASKRSPERKLRNELLSIRYKMEDYIENRANEIETPLTLDKFLNEYLKALNLTKKKFAISIDTTDGNLKKYLSGDRKFNTDLALKFAYFFHTPPTLWLHVYYKNEMIKLRQKTKWDKKYKKYNYEKVL